MINIIIGGANGAMGNVLRQAIAKTSDMQVIAGIDKNTLGADAAGFPIYPTPEACIEKADIIIDFSHHSATESLLAYCVESKTPVVLATTALDESALVKVEDAAKVIPVFRSANMSLGINIISKMMELAVPVLEDGYNIEIIEKHHNKKVDSPSGTALLLADVISNACKTEKNYLYGRHGRADSCKMTDLGIHAIRGGTIAGEHTILFAGDDEVIEITHRAMSKNIFANGALAAARFLVRKAPGLYSMNDMLS